MPATRQPKPPCHFSLHNPGFPAVKTALTRNAPGPSFPNFNISNGGKAAVVNPSPVFHCGATGAAHGAGRSIVPACQVKTF